MSPHLLCDFKIIARVVNFVTIMKFKFKYSPRRKKPPKADELRFFLSVNDFLFSNGGDMLLGTFKPGDIVKAIIAPFAKGKPSNAALSGNTFVSNDTTVATVANDPAITNGCIITMVGSGSGTTATIAATATATEADGRTGTVTGTVSVSLETALPDQADELQFTLTSVNGVPVPPAIP